MDLICINDRESFRKGYEYIKILERMSGRHDLGDSSQELLDKYIVDLKRELRKYSHKNPYERMAIWAGIVESRIAWNYGLDGYVELITFPEGIDTEEVADRLFNAYIRIDYTPTYYDCTGQAFTSWYYVFKRNGRCCVYHSVGIDI